MRWEHWVTPTVFGHAEDAWRSRLVLESLLVSVGASALTSLGLAFNGAWAAFAVTAVFTVASWAAFLWVRSSGRYTLAGHLILTVAVVGFFADSLRDPVFDPMLIAWFATVPVAASTMLGGRALWFWLAAACGACVLTWALGTPKYPGATPDQLKQVLRGLGAAGLTFMFAWRLEAERQKALWSMASVDQLKSSFLVNLSHELKTPLNGILGSAEDLSLSQLTAPQQGAVGSITQSARALASRLDDVLDMALLEAGRLSLEPRPFAVERLLQEVAAGFTPHARGRALILRVEVAPGVPAGLRGDARRLAQVLSKLLDNALRFTAQGEVVLAAKVDGDFVRFEVRDTGVGLPSAVLPRLFIAFEQVDARSTRLHGGMGLGLALAHHLAVLMGARLRVQSAEGVGSTFWFDLPLALAVDAPLAPAPLSTPASPGVALDPAQGVPLPLPPPVPSSPSALSSPRAVEPASGPRRVLVVEDNAMNARVACALLGKLGHTTQVAVNGEEALRALESQTFDLILMDCHMPVMDGLEATRRIRALSDGRAASPIVALTAGGTPEQLQACLDAGMNETLVKPVSVQTLARIIASLVRAGDQPRS